MNRKEIVKSFKNGDSTQKLAITSDISTLIGTIVAIVTSQIFTIRFVFNEYTFIRIAFYLIAFGISLFALFVFLKLLSYLIKEFRNKIFILAIAFMTAGIFLLISSTVWTFVLTIE